MLPYTVNQLLFNFIYCNLPEIDWFAETNFQDQDVDYMENNIPETYGHLLAAINIHYDEALVNLM